MWLSALPAVFLALRVPSPVSQRSSVYMDLSRRQALASSGAVVLGGSGLINPVAASESTPLAASWSATDGFNESSFISFDVGAYKAMVDDEVRAPSPRLPPLHIP